MNGFEKIMRAKEKSERLDRFRIVPASKSWNIRYPLFPSSLNRRQTRASVFCSSLAACLFISGCGGSSAKPMVGAITPTDIKGVSQPAIKSLAVGSGSYLDVTLTNDTSLLGAQWTVSCGSALPPGTPLPPGQTIDTSCGYFTPIHTASAPVPAYAEDAEGIITYYTAPAAPPKAGTVTLYASSSADPSQFSTLSLVITGQPITIAITASTPPPFILSTGGTISLTGTLSNDYTVGGGSIIWSVSCKSSDCGSVGTIKTMSGTTITYTAPATQPSGDAITVTATSVTEPSVSNSVTITIT